MATPENLKSSLSTVSISSESDVSLRSSNQNPLAQPTSPEESDAMKVSSETQLVLLTSFTKFALLPPEIRLKIWKIVAHQPRTLLIYTKSKMIRGPGAFRCTGLELMENYCCCTPIPSSLHVNRESRIETMRYFTILFGKMYINQEVDMFVPSGNLGAVISPYNHGHEPQWTTGLLPRNLGMIKHFGLLNITGACSWHKKMMENERRAFMISLPALETITFFVGNWEADGRSPITPIDEEIDRKTDLISFSEQKRLIQAVKDDYETYTDWAGAYGKVVLKAQMDRLGGHSPTVVVKRYVS